MSRASSPRRAAIIAEPKARVASSVRVAAQTAGVVRVPRQVNPNRRPRANPKGRANRIRVKANPKVTVSPDSRANASPRIEVTANIASRMTTSRVRSTDKVMNSPAKMVSRVHRVRVANANLDSRVRAVAEVVAEVVETVVTEAAPSVVATPQQRVAKNRATPEGGEKGASSDRREE